MGADFKKDRPPLTRENVLVYEAWAFCGGWSPERIPYAAAYLGVRDIDFLTAQLIAMRDRMDLHRKAQ